MTEITRRYRKERTHFTITPELDAALDQLVGHGNRSAYVEQVVWAALIEEFGQDEVLGAVEDAQSDLDGRELLEPRQINV